MPSCVVATPAAFSAAAEDLTGIGSAIWQAYATAAASTLRGLPAAHGTPADHPSANNVIFNGGNGGSSGNGSVISTTIG